MLQQIAVIAGELDDEAVGAKPKRAWRSSRNSACACATQEVE